MLVAFGCKEGGGDEILVGHSEGWLGGSLQLLECIDVLRWGMGVVHNLFMGFLLPLRMTFLVDKKYPLLVYLVIHVRCSL